MGEQFLVNPPEGVHLIEGGHSRSTESLARRNRHRCPQGKADTSSPTAINNLIVTREVLCIIVGRHHNTRHGTMIGVIAPFTLASMMIFPSSFSV